MLREWNKEAEALTHTKRGSSWGSCDGRLAAVRICFDGGVGSLCHENGQTLTLKVAAGWRLQVAEAWEELGTPPWQTVLNVCIALPDDFTVTQAELTAATEATMAVISQGSTRFVAVEVNWSKVKRGLVSTDC